MKSVKTPDVRRRVVAGCAAAVVFAAALVTIKGLLVTVYAQDDAATYDKVVQTLRKELAMPFTNPDDPGLAQRRARLRTLFAGVPPSYAKTLADRLGPKPTGDDLSKEFHYRLATATRQELLGILAKIPAPAAAPPPPAPAPTPVLVWGTRPLPASESGRFDAALRHLEDLVNKSTDDRKWRYQCWIQKLKMPNVDDRVITWSRICPAKTGALGAAYIVGPCDITMGTPVSQDDLYNNIKSIADVEAKGGEVGIFTYLKSDFVVSEEMTSMQMENLRMTHDNVIMAIDKLRKWADNPMGGSSAMAKEYVSIKDWIGQRQDDPKSLYSCK
jgi:hypothetical protein